jgi:arylsulfatase A-like enzyme
MKSTRREFIQQSATLSAAAMLGGLAGPEKAAGTDASRSHPNILLIMVDQQHIPPPYGPGVGMAQGLKEILGFEELSPDNPYTRYFPGNLRLRQNAVVLKRHYTASSACTPSRACIMTSSYTTGVDVTNGMFTTLDELTWLDPDTPTIGDWFQAAGYSTYYFGKWHVSDPENASPQGTFSMEPWGFPNWGATEDPEPHGSEPTNAGVYRDVGFTDDLCDFLSGEAKATSTPWLAVGSLVNPHDLGLYPTPWTLPGDAGVMPWPSSWANTIDENTPPLPIPQQGQQSLPKQGDPNNGRIVDLNPAGFPQDTWSVLPPTFGECLDTKPRCQKEYAIKMGLILEGSQESGNCPTAYPFQFQTDAYGWFLGYNQFRMYCHYLADIQICRVFQALDANQLTENTIVVFLSDHGELGGAHGGMIQKWHNAYEESIRVPMVVSSSLVNRNKNKMREVHQTTSSIDVAPTLLGLAGFKQNDLRAIMEASHGKSKVKPFMGADLSAIIRGASSGAVLGPDGKPRPGAFYMTNDDISVPGTEQQDLDRYNSYCADVELAQARPGYELLTDGSITQPNHVRALCTGDWKIVSYLDPNDVEPDEWELYCLVSDPTEQNNLADFRTGELREEATVPGLNGVQLRKIAQLLKEELAYQEALLMGES